MFIVGRLTSLGGLPQVSARVLSSGTEERQCGNACSIANPAVAHNAMHRGAFAPSPDPKRAVTRSKERADSGIGNRRTRRKLALHIPDAVKPPKPKRRAQPEMAIGRLRERLCGRWQIRLETSKTHARTD